MLGVDVLRGELHWGWSQGMNQQQLIPIFRGWPMDGVVWDGAPSHRGKLMGQVGFARIFLPAYSPELNPTERVFEGVRHLIGMSQGAIDQGCIQDRRTLREAYYGGVRGITR